MKKISLDMQHRFMARSSEVVNLPSNASCVMRHAACMRCVVTSGSRLAMFILLVEIDFRTSSIQDSVCSHC